MASLLARLLCREHEFLTCVDGTLIYGECLHCGHKSPGWETKSDHPPRPILYIDRASARQLHRELLDLEMTLIGGG